MTTKTATSMVLGQIRKHIGDKNRRTVQVRVKHLEMNNFLTMYFSKVSHVLADDPNEECNVGDHVVIKQLEKPIRLNVTHTVKEIVFKLGEHVDPVTGLECAGPIYRDGQLPDPHQTLEKYGVRYVPNPDSKLSKIN